MTRVALLAFLLAACLAAGCAPPACSDAEERTILSEVKALVEQDGPAAEKAADQLVARGRRSIALIETGLYAAEAPARLRIIRTLARIGSKEAAPILSHLAKHDSDPEVRDAAQRAIASLTHP